MSVIIKIITGSEYLIPLESFLILYFTVLGILVTLIAISSSITKEVRQELFFNNYINSDFLRLFFIFYIAPFLIGFIGYILNFRYLNQFLMLSIPILFFWVLYTVILFIKRTNRGWLYQQLFKRFKSDFEKETKRIEEKNEPHTKTRLTSLDDFLKNLTYIETTSSDFIEEIEFINGVGRVALKTDKGYIFDLFFEQLKKVENPRFFSKLRSSLYYSMREDYFDNLRVVIKLQTIYTGLVIHGLSKTKEFDESLDIDGFRIKDSFDIRYVHTYEKTTDKEWIKDYDALAVNTINKVFNLCWLIIYLDIHPKYKKRYLTGQLSSMVKILEYYNNVHGQDFLKDYNYLKYNEDRSEAGKKSLKLADKKVKIIKDLKEVLWGRVSKLFYMILYEIDLGALQKDFFETTLKIFKIEEFEKQYYNYYMSRDLNFLNYDRFQGGAQSVASFNFIKYKLLLSLYEYLQKNDLDIRKYSDEHFSKHKMPGFYNQVDILDSDFVRKYFDIDQKKLDEFREKVKKELDNKVKNLEKNKREYIADTDLKEEFVNKFKSDCKEYWNKNQEFLKRFLKYTKKDGGNKVKNFFGQYTLYDKEWFLDSFDKTVSLVRISGEGFGRDQVRSKTEAILSKIHGMFDGTLDNPDKEIIVKDLYADMKKEIVKKKEYFLFYNRDIWDKISEDARLYRELYKSQHIETKQIEINNSKIYLCYANIENSLLFKKDSFILEQFKEGYEDIKEPLVVQIEEIKDKNDIKKIIKPNGRFKTEEDVKQMVKLRIAEKFEIKRNGKSSFVRLKV